MISTVTTVTTTALASSFALLATVTLLALLVQKEFLNYAQEKHWQRLRKALNVVILPFTLTFLAISVVEVMKVL